MIHEININNNNVNAAAKKTTKADLDIKIDVWREF